MDAGESLRDASIRAAAITYFGGRQRPSSQKELSEYLCVSRYTPLRYRRDGVLKAFLRGNTVRYPVESVYLFLMRQTV